MENSEAFLAELEEFNASDDLEKPLTSTLDSFIDHVSKSGSCTLPWYKIRKLYLSKLNSVLANLSNMFVMPISKSTSSSSCFESTSTHFNSTEHYNATISTTTVTTTTSQSFNCKNDSTASMSGTDSKCTNDTIQILKDRIVERMKSFSNAPFTIQRISELLLKPNSHYNRAEKFLRGLEKCIMVVTTVDQFGNKIFIENYQANGITRSPSPSTTPKRPDSPSVEMAPSTTTPTVLETVTATTSMITETTTSVIDTNESNAEHVPIVTATSVTSTTLIDKVNEPPSVLIATSIVVAADDKTITEATMLVEEQKKSVIDHVESAKTEEETSEKKTNKLKSK